MLYDVWPRVVSVWSPYHTNKNEMRVFAIAAHKKTTFVKTSSKMKSRTEEANRLICEPENTFIVNGLTFLFFVQTSAAKSYLIYCILQNAGR